MDSAFTSGKKLLRGGYTQFTLSGKSYFVQNGAYGKIPHSGDIVYFYSTEKGRVAHVGIVEDVKRIGQLYIIHTIEGNTSAKAFERNGGGVARKEYKFKESDVGGANRINGFGTPAFSRDTCTPEELIEVARQEIGYLEKASNSMLEDKTANAGMSNYTKYGHWYGGNGNYWCQQFVSWCAYQACKLHQKNSFTGWKKVDGRWMYELEGIVQRDKWLRIDNRWYVVDGAGHMITGWFKSGDTWYYLNTDGAMLSGQWVELSGESYYLTQSGAMASSSYIKNSAEGVYHWVDADGKYRKELDTKTPDFDKYEIIE